MKKLPNLLIVAGAGVVLSDAVEETKALAENCHAPGTESTSR